jgi:hypothetical protein
VWNRESVARRYLPGLQNHLLHHWFFDAVQVLAILCIAYWLRHLPAPGYSVAVLGVLAAIMSLHVGMHALQKVLWMVLMGGFLILEFQAIRKDRSDFAKAEEAKRQEQLSQFNTTVDCLQGGYKSESETIRHHDVWDKRDFQFGNWW